MNTVNLTVSKSDCKSLLSSLHSSLEAMDYPNTGVFSECLKLILQSYLRGRGIHLDGVTQQKCKEKYVLFLADVLWEVAVEDETYDWFIRWITRLDKMMKEREISP